MGLAVRTDMVIRDHAWDVAGPLPEKPSPLPDEQPEGMDSRHRLRCATRREQDNADNLTKSVPGKRRIVPT